MIPDRLGKSLTKTTGATRSTRSWTFPNSPGVGQEYDIISACIEYDDTATAGGRAITPPLLRPILGIIKNADSATDTDPIPVDMVRHHFDLYFPSEDRAISNWNPPLPILVPENHYIKIWLGEFLLNATVHMSLFIIERDRDTEPYLQTLYNRVAVPEMMP